MVLGAQYLKMSPLTWTVYAMLHVAGYQTGGPFH